MKNVHSIASINAIVTCLEAQKVVVVGEIKPYPHFGYTLHFFAFLCKSLSQNNLASFLNKPITNL